MDIDLGDLSQPPPGLGLRYKSGTLTIPYAGHTCRVRLSLTPANREARELIAYWLRSKGFPVELTEPDRTRWHLWSEVMMPSDIRIIEHPELDDPDPPSLEILRACAAEVETQAADLLRAASWRDLGDGTWAPPWLEEST